MKPDPIAVYLPVAWEPGANESVKILQPGCISGKAFVVVLIQQPVQRVLPAWHFSPRISISNFVQPTSRIDSISDNTFGRIPSAWDRSRPFCKMERLLGLFHCERLSSCGTLDADARAQYACAAHELHMVNLGNSAACECL
jgi:hypothetical protein